MYLYSEHKSFFISFWDFILEERCLFLTHNTEEWTDKYLPKKTPGQKENPRSKNSHAPVPRRLQRPRYDRRYSIGSYITAVTESNIFIGLHSPDGCRNQVSVLLTLTCKCFFFFFVLHKIAQHTLHSVKKKNIFTNGSLCVFIVANIEAFCRRYMLEDLMEGLNVM